MKCIWKWRLHNFVSASICLIHFSYFKVTISVHIPVDAVVGDYQAAVIVTYKDADNAEKTEVNPLADPIIILFNPFCKGKFVFHEQKFLSTCYPNCAWAQPMRNDIIM